MATLAGVTIADKNSPFDSGAAFLLAQECDLDELIPLSPEREVEVRRNSPYVVARIKGALSATDAFNQSHEVVQQGLDLLSVQGKAHLSTRNAFDERLVWWRDSSTQILRVVSVVNLLLKTGLAKITVTDQYGNVVPPPPPPSIIYHESFRYIRLSQVTDDLFDAFRNMYLAFELLLEHVAPRRKSEREGAWIKRALAAVNSAVPLSRAFTPTSSDIVADIHDQIYVEIRCAIFHAKESPRLLPQNLSDRKKVGDGLKKLTRLAILIADHWLHARSPAGGLTYAGFNLMTTPVLERCEILVSDSNAPLHEAETLESPLYKDAAVMNTRYAPDLSEPGLNFAFGAIDTVNLLRLSRIARFGVKYNNDLLMEATLEAELKHVGIDRLEAQLGIQLRNLRSPKHLYNR